MALVNSKQLFKKALEGNYAIGAFNFVNFETLSAILNASQKNNSPVIIQSSVGAIKYSGHKTLQALVNSLTQDLNIDVCFNLDHGKTFEDCKNAIDFGFTNVMIDASDLPYEQNVALTKQVVEYAHKHGVTVEAELGTLQGVEDEVSVSKEDAFYTVPEQVYEFVKATNCDSLAIAIGTSHGAYKYSGSPYLRFDILKEIEELLPNFPLVLHGASSVPQNLVERVNALGSNLQGAKGIDENDLLTACTKHNICKVNVDTDLRIAFLTGIKEHLNQNPENIDIRAYLKNGTKEVEQVVSYKMQNILNSAGKNS